MITIELYASKLIFVEQNFEHNRLEKEELLERKRGEKKAKLTTSLLHSD